MFSHLRIERKKYNILPVVSRTRHQILGQHFTLHRRNPTAVYTTVTLLSTLMSQRDNCQYDISDSDSITIVMAVYSTVP